MQRRVGEHRVELLHEVERVAVGLADVEAFHACHGKQLVREIDAEHVGSRGLDLRGQRSITAAKVENALAGLRREHGEDGARQILHEAPVLRIVGGRPALNGNGRRGVRRGSVHHSGRHGS
jgi:hypothetical protein